MDKKEIKRKCISEVLRSRILDKVGYFLDEVDTPLSLKHCNDIINDIEVQPLRISKLEAEISSLQAQNGGVVGGSDLSKKLDSFLQGL